MVYLLKIVIFYSYVKLPEGSSYRRFDPGQTGYPKICWEHLKIWWGRWISQPEILVLWRDVHVVCTCGSIPGRNGVAKKTTIMKPYYNQYIYIYIYQYIQPILRKNPHISSTPNRHWIRGSGSVGLKSGLRLSSLKLNPPTYPLEKQTLLSHQM